MPLCDAELESRLRPYLAEQSVARCRRHYESWIAGFGRIGIAHPEQLDGDARDLLDLVVLNARPRGVRRSPQSRRIEHDLRDAVTAKFPGFFERRRPYKGS